MAVRWLQETRTWVLEGERAAYVLGVHPEGWLQHLYWGKRLVHLGDYPEPGREHGDSSFDVGLNPDRIPRLGRHPLR